MPPESFRVTYIGNEVRTGAMGVDELASALQALGTLIRDSNRILNGDQATVALKVDSEFRKGSFEIKFLLEQQLVETAVQTFGFSSLVDVHGLLHALFGTAMEHRDQLAEVTLAGLFAIYRLLKGKKPEPKTLVINDNHGVINIGDREIRVDARGAQLYVNDTVRSDLDQIARTVAREGIEKLEVHQDEALVEQLSKEDLPSHVKALEAPQESTEHTQTDTREALLKVVTANFEEGKWKFSDGQAKFNASIVDPIFQQRLDDREEGFFKGDVLRVVLKTEQVERATGKIQARYMIEEVLEHRRAGLQQHLPGADTSRPRRTIRRN